MSEHLSPKEGISTLAPRRSRIFAAVTALIYLLPAAAFAANVTYTVDPARSSLTLSGSVGSSGPLSITSQNGQLPSSLTTTYFGTITADRDISSDTPQITGGDIRAENSGMWSPISAPASYGLLASTHSHPGTAYFAAISDISLAPTTSPIQSPTTFDASLISMAFLAGQLDSARTDFYDTFQITTQGSAQLVGAYTLAPATASLTITSDTETLTIPVNMDFLVQDSASFAFAVHMSGNLVAATSVPEPTSLALFASSAFLLVIRRGGMPKPARIHEVRVHILPENP